jgi:hypothetical protein
LIRRPHIQLIAATIPLAGLLSAGPHQFNFAILRFLGDE